MGNGNAKGYPPADEAKVLYLESKFITWSEFATAIGWDVQASRIKYPVSGWVAEKRRKYAADHAEDIKGSIFDHRIRYRKDVLATLRDYPTTADAIHTLIRHKVNGMIEELAKDPKATRTVIVKGKPFEVPVLDSEELVKLSLAMKTITESKHKSLLLSDVVARIAEQAPPEIEPVDGQEEAAKQQGFRLEILGMGEVSLKDLQRLQAEYVDAPTIPKPELPAPEPKPLDPIEALLAEDDPDVGAPR